MTNKEKKAQLCAKRLEEFNKLCKDMEDKGYSAVNAVLSERQDYFLMLCCSVPFIVLILALYIWRASTFVGIYLHSEYGSLMFIPFFILSVFVHEYLHGIGWMLAGKLDKSHIHIDFNLVMPLCHCDVPLKGKAYLIGVLLPVAVLGFIPAALMFILPTGFLMRFAVYSVFIACGDLFIALRTLKHMDDMIFDHPNKPGFVAFIVT